MILCSFFGSIFSATSADGGGKVNPQEFFDYIKSEADWLLTIQMESGAIGLTPAKDRIVPYFSHIVALGLAKAYQLIGDERYIAAVRKWIDWYSAHQNKQPDRFGLVGTIYDYYVVNGTEKYADPPDYDSSDSYAALFLDVLWRYFELTGDRAFLQSKADAARLAVEAIMGTMDTDGLTTAKPNWPIKYLMDNAEVYAGLESGHKLFETLGDKKYNETCRTNSEKVRKAILSMWDPNSNSFKWAKDKAGSLTPTNWNKWYPDTMENYWPIIFDVLQGNSEIAAHVWKGLKAHWPNWYQISPRSEAKSHTAYMATSVGDVEAARNYMNSAITAYIEEGRNWPWSSVESAWLIRSLTWDFDVYGGVHVVDASTEIIDGLHKRLVTKLSGVSAGSLKWRVKSPIQSSESIEVRVNGSRHDFNLLTLGEQNYVIIHQILPNSSVEITAPYKKEETKPPSSDMFLSAVCFVGLALIAFVFAWFIFIRRRISVRTSNNSLEGTSSHSSRALPPCPLSLTAQGQDPKGASLTSLYLLYQLQRVVHPALAWACRAGLRKPGLASLDPLALMTELDSLNKLVNRLIVDFFEAYVRTRFELLLIETFWKSSAFGIMLTT